MTDWQWVFNEVLHAEDEAEVLRVLLKHRLMADEQWLPLGGEENNWSIVGGQHSDPTGALVEKLINSIDAMLMSECHKRGIDPESAGAPQSMGEAAEAFFGIKDGRLGLLGRSVRSLAEGVQLVAVGSRESPSYLVIDRGEGQAPEAFRRTFLSLAKSNKLRIPFVQGKFNAGGTGVLPFCGRENVQMIASRRQPGAPLAVGESSDAWGFTVVRRMEALETDSRKSSMFVFLAPDGEIPRFVVDGVNVLPGASRKNDSCLPYAGNLEFGTVVKLYNYRWRARSLATTEARFELEKYLHSPCLPVRISEARTGFRANYYSTTLSGVWAAIEGEETDEDHRKVEVGFPAPGTIQMDEIGLLAYKVAVFKDDVDTRRVPTGVVFSVNGQVQGETPADFVGRRLGFDYLRGHLLVSVDCSHMTKRAREDFFMASRDRLRRDEHYEEILARLEAELRGHPGLKELNAARRAKAMQKALNDDAETRATIGELLKADPTLRNLLDPGAKLVTKVGPTQVEAFKGVRFPTYFRLKNDPSAGLVRECPINRSIKIEFETDAVNDYLERSESPGELRVSPVSAYVDYRPWNGTFTLRFRPPRSATVGDAVAVRVEVTDPDRASKGYPPFEAAFTIAVAKEDTRPSSPGGDGPGPLGPDVPGTREREQLALPNIVEIRRSQWGAWSPPFSAQEALRVKSGLSGGDGKSSYDFIVNLDSEYLLTQLRASKDQDKDLIVYWFKWGLALSALGMLQHRRRVQQTENDGEAEFEVDLVNKTVSGVGSVIVPIIRTLYRGPAPDATR